MEAHAPIVAGDWPPVLAIRSQPGADIAIRDALNSGQGLGLCVGEPLRIARINGRRDFH
jgi:hypothetical protein